MKKYIVGWVTIMIFCSACSMLNKYEGYMQDAKDSMRESHYEETLTHLNNALIEEPTSKDALALKKMAEEAFNKEKAESEKAMFISETEPIYNKLLNLTEEFNEDASNVTIKGANYLLEDLKPLEIELSNISENWESSEQHSSSFGYLTGAVEDLNQTLTAIIENIYEPIDYNGDYSRKNKVEKYLTSNDSSIRAKRYISDFRLKMDSFVLSLQK